MKSFESTVGEALFDCTNHFEECRYRMTRGQKWVAAFLADRIFPGERQARAKVSTENSRVLGRERKRLEVESAP